MAKMVLVTGAAGYIGGETVLRLKDQGHTVIGVDIRPAPGHLRHSADRFFQEDFSSRLGLDIIAKFSPDVIVHCAGSSLVGPSIGNPRQYYHNNFCKTKTLVDYLLDHAQRKLPRIVFSSSAAVYGEPVMTPCREEDPALPISPYGESKLMIEMMLNSYHRAYNLESVSFRYFNACGADSLNRHGQEPGATHIIARVLESIRNDQDFVLFGDSYATADGSCVRDYVHVEDIANAHVAAVENQVPTGAYNLGTNQGISNLEIVAMAEKITGRRVKLMHGPNRVGDPAVLTASAEKFQAAGAWQARFTLEDMIAHAWKWYTR
jgi:UDP-glucose 4-epimerase